MSDFNILALDGSDSVANSKAEHSFTETTKKIVFFADVSSHLAEQEQILKFELHQS